MTVKGQTDTGVYVAPTATEVTVSATQYDVIIDSNVAKLNTIIVPSNVTNATINMTDLMIITNEERIVNTPANNVLKIQSSTSVMEIPANTKISAASDSNWTGVINIPTVKLNSSITVIPDSGKTALVDSVIEIGFGDVELILDKAVKILFVGKAGKYVGYSRGGVFTPIIATCGENSQTWADTNLGDGGDCKIDSDSGSDLIVWTKHFTKFVTYTQTVIPPVDSSSSSGTVIIRDASTSSTSDVDFEVAKTTAKTEITGDTNNDGKVNKYDFALMMADWGKTGLSVLSDLNQDSKVDKYDFALLMVNWSL